MSSVQFHCYYTKHLPFSQKVWGARDLRKGLLTAREVGSNELLPAAAWLSPQVLQRAQGISVGSEGTLLIHP